MILHIFRQKVVPKSYCCCLNIMWVGMGRDQSIKNPHYETMSPLRIVEWFNKVKVISKTWWGNQVLKVT